MKRAEYKLKSNRGASIVIALVIFMLCALAGSSAFMMAAANAGRYAHADEQEYYSVSSAALMMADLIDGLTYTSEPVQFDYERTWQYTADKHDESDGYTLTIPSESEVGSFSGADTLRASKLTLGNKMLEHCNKLVPYLYVPEEWYSAAQTGTAAAPPTRPSEPQALKYNFTVNVNKSDNNADSRYKEVTCNLVMYANFDLLLSFGYGEGSYSVTVYWTADVDPIKATGDPEYVYTAGSAGSDYSSGHQTQHTTLQVVATWNKQNITISRGEAIANV